MQFYNFIFLERSWASDRIHLSKSLSWLARRAEKEDSPLTFILYPEGTLVSKDTRPISKKYADKLGIVRLELCSGSRSRVHRLLTARHDERSIAAVNRIAPFSPIACAAHSIPTASRHHCCISR